MRYHTLPLLLLSFVVGCAKDVQEFNVKVTNNTAFSLTLDFNKNVKQSEYLWASPDDLVSGRVILMPDERTGMLDGLEPGKTGSRTISGHFKEGEHAILCIYRYKNLKMKDLLSTQPGRDRQNVDLTPGDNVFVVTDPGESLVVTRVEPPVPAK